MAQVTLLGEEAEETAQKKNPEKVEIIIEPGHHYDKSHKNGAEYTSVDFSARTYGGCSGRDTDEEINNSVKHYKEWIIRKGDIPVGELPPPNIWFHQS